MPERPIAYYLGLLRLVHEELAPRTYLEIGVYHGDSLALAGPATRAVGVDPLPKVRCRLDRSTQVFAMTSDDFFDRHDVPALFGGRRVDVAFIDGLHHFENALRDFANTEAVCEPGSVILVDDSLPRDAVTASRERLGREWAGDVWKAVLAIIQARPDLSVHTVDVPPTGVTVITGLDPGSTVIADRFDELCELYADRSFEEVSDDLPEMLNTVPADRDVVRSLLPATPYGAPARAGRVRRALRFPTVPYARWRASQVARRVGLMR